MKLHDDYLPEGFTMGIGTTGRGPHKPLARLLGVAAVLAASWAVTRVMTARAQAGNPPKGRFVEVQGLRLHYTVHGDAAHPPLVLLHGNGTSSLEMEISGLVEHAARHFRVYAFDRPGYGHSERPAQGHSWTPQAQAELFLAALRELDVQRPVVLGHSWGAMVALSMALAEPQALRALVLAAGYYTPSLRLDAPLMGMAALPVIGPLMRHTVSPLVGRLMWPLMLKRIFAPAAVTPAFKRRFPAWMSLRPHTLQASAAESGMMVWQGLLQRLREGTLAVPTAIVAGEGDLLVMTRWQSQRLHERLPQTRLHLVPGAGHMLHHTHTHAVMDALYDAWHMSEPLVTTSSSLAEASMAPVVEVNAALEQRAV